MGSRVVIDQQALATSCVYWKRTVPYSNAVKRTAQTIRTGYTENIVVLESGYFFDYLFHWNWFLLSLSNFNLLLYIFFNSRGRVPLAGNSLKAEKSHWQVQKVTLEGPKSHTRAKMSHGSVIIHDDDLGTRPRPASGDIRQDPKNIPGVAPEGLLNKLCYLSNITLEGNAYHCYQCISWQYITMLLMDIFNKGFAARSTNNYTTIIWFRICVVCNVSGLRSLSLESTNVSAFKYCIYLSRLRAEIGGIAATAASKVLFPLY